MNTKQKTTYDFKVGDVHHDLTIISASPFILRCKCGEELTKYKPSHLFRGRVRSCGCARRYVDMSPGTVYGTIKILKCLNPDRKATQQAYDVECQQCGNTQIMGYSSINARYKRKIGCYNCVFLHKEKLRRHRMPGCCTRIALQPSIEAFVRTYCEKYNMTIIAFIRAAMQDMFENATPEDARFIPSHAEVYGKLSRESFNIDLTARETEMLLAFAKRMKIYASRSMAKIIRFAVNRYCETLTFSSFSHDEGRTRRLRLLDA